MARLPRLHRVVGVWADGKRRTKLYLTPEAAEARRKRWAGEPGPLDSAHDDNTARTPAASVTVSPSYPVTWPSTASDRFDIPDGIMSRAGADDLLARLGLRPDAVQSITVSREHLIVVYDPDPDRPGKREPKTWTIYVEDPE